MVIISIALFAQYKVKNNIVLSVLETKDELFISQLDSILFKEYPCLLETNIYGREYVYYLHIKNKAKIDIIYAKPSLVEKKLNQGIFCLNDAIFIVRDDSEDPLFTLTKKQFSFPYNKEVMLIDGKGHQLIEMDYPEEVCGWLLEYDGKKLKVQKLEMVKGTHRPSRFP